MTGKILSDKQIKQTTSFNPLVETMVYMSMSVNFFTFQAADSKREEFRKYLEKAGVLDPLTKGQFGPVP